MTARDSKRRVLIIDGGTSSTVGVPDLMNTNDENGKLDILSDKIVEEILPDVSLSKWLGILVTHADIDHLNLIRPILKKILDNQSSLTNIGVLLGGSRENYSSQESEALVSFLDIHNIVYAFGGSGFQFDPQGLFVTPKPNVFPNLDAVENKVYKHIMSWGKTEENQENKIKLLSVKADKLQKNKNKETLKNAESVVLILSFGSESLMITGDKTRSELLYLIKRFSMRNAQANLKVSYVLATHHGSGDDFCQELYDVTSPSAIFVSAGRSSSLLPRATAILPIVNYLRAHSHINQNLWHKATYFGESIINVQGFESILTETNNTENRSYGYTHAVSNLPLYFMASQGTTRIINDFLTAQSVIEPVGEERKEDLILTFIQNPTLLDGTLIKPLEIYLCNLTTLNVLFLRYDTLTALNLDNCNLDPKQLRDLADIVKNMNNLSKLTLRNNIEVDQEVRELFKQCWNNRGLQIG